jgi:hypothetical protein
MRYSWYQTGDKIFIDFFVKDTNETDINTDESKGNRVILNLY